MPNSVGTQIARSLDWIVCKSAAVTFNTIQYFNKRNPNPSVTPQWSDKPLLKSWEKTKPTLGFPRKIGYNSVQAATNGIEFAKSKEFCKKAFEAGMRYAYLQFDGIGNDANGHRQIGNLFDVKLRAIENMHEAGIEIVLVVTIVNNVNNDQVGTVVKFAMENPKKIAFVSFQPVSFTGRDEDVTPERRLRQRYTLSHLAKDVSTQV